MTNTDIDKLVRWLRIDRDTPRSEAEWRSGAKKAAAALASLTAENEREISRAQTALESLNKAQIAAELLIVNLRAELARAQEARDIFAAALVCCVSSLNEISKEWGGGGRFKAWSHPENSLRMADVALALLTEAERQKLPTHFKEFAASVAALRPDDPRPAPPCAALDASASQRSLFPLTPRCDQSRR